MEFEAERTIVDRVAQKRRDRAELRKDSIEERRVDLEHQVKMQALADEKEMRLLELKVRLLEVVANAKAAGVELTDVTNIDGLELPPSLRRLSPSDGESSAD